MAIDTVTFVAAIGTIMLVYIPQPPTSAEGEQAQGSFWQEVLYGFRYIAARPGLLGLQLVFFAVNLVTIFGLTLLAPRVLAATNNSELLLGTVQSAAGIGGVVGGALLSIWGGPKRRVNGVLLGMVGLGLLGNLLMGLGQSVVVWAAAAFCVSFFAPLINGSNQAIWQSKVAPDVQGRVFAARRLIAQIAQPAALLAIGPLTDQVIGPAMQPEGSLAPIFGPLVGTGPGAGIAVIFILAGLLSALIGLCGYLFRSVREVETTLPDYVPPAPQD